MEFASSFGISSIGHSYSNFSPSSGSVRRGRTTNTVHVDLACTLGLNWYGFGGSISSSSGDIVLRAKSCDVFKNLCLAIRLDLTEVHVLSDSLSLIQMFRGSKVANYVADIWDILD